MAPDRDGVRADALGHRRPRGDDMARAGFRRRVAAVPRDARLQRGVRLARGQALRLGGVMRCKWAESNELLAAYHDAEWGVPVHDDRLLFEMLNLEGAQAGLSWLTVLRKRANYKRLFDDFDAKKNARYGAAEKPALLKDEGIVRNRQK